MNGKPTDQMPSLAAAAFKLGRLRLGHSFRFHEPRGAFCHGGWCQQCKVQLQDGRVGLACQLPADELKLLAKPGAMRRPLGYIARTMLRPWFHERALFGSRALRSIFLAVIRRSSGALPLPAAAPSPAPAWERLDCDLVVVGAGPAGRAAVEEAMLAGVDTMIVSEGVRRNDAGDALDPGRFIRGLAVGLYEDPASPSGHHLLCSTGARQIRLRFRRMVVATGAYERLPMIPGGTMPGILSLSAFERLSRAGAIPAHYRVVVHSPATGLQRAAEAAARHGLTLALALGGTLPAGAAARVLPNAHPVRAGGRTRLKWLELNDGSTVRCDILVNGYMQPGYELQMQAGQRVSLSGKCGPIRTDGETLFPLLAVGAAAGHDRIEAASSAASSTRSWLADGVRPASRPDSDSCPATLSDSVVICPCEDVTVRDVRQSIRDGFDEVEHLKRRTGAGTGPCQGKLCHTAILELLAQSGISVALPTIRPLARPARLSTFAGSDDARNR